MTLGRPMVPAVAGGVVVRNASVVMGDARHAPFEKHTVERPERKQIITKAVESWADDQASLSGHQKVFRKRNCDHLHFVFLRVVQCRKEAQSVSDRGKILAQNFLGFFLCRRHGVSFLWGRGLVLKGLWGRKRTVSIVPALYTQIWTLSSTKKQLANFDFNGNIIYT